MLLMVVILLIIPSLFTPNIRANLKPLSHWSGTQHYPGSTLGPASSCPSSSWGRGGGVMTLRVQADTSPPPSAHFHITPLSLLHLSLSMAPVLLWNLNYSTLFLKTGILCSSVFTCLLSGLSHVFSLRPHGLQPARLLCPRDSPGKNTGMGPHALLQGGSSSPRDRTHVSFVSGIGR